MYGQFKSRIECPSCDVVSSCYDPFLVCPIPVPNPRS